MAEGWFADIGDDVSGPYTWQPFLQTKGKCLPLPVWFISKEECEEFISQEVIGKEALD